VNVGIPGEPEIKTMKFTEGVRVSGGEDKTDGAEDGRRTGKESKVAYRPAQAKIGKGHLKRGGSRAEEFAWTNP